MLRANSYPISLSHIVFQGEPTFPEMIVSINYDGLVVICRRFPCLYQRSGRQFCHISYVNGGFFLFLLAFPVAFRLTPSSVSPAIGAMKNHRIPHDSDTYSSSESRITDFHLTVAENVLDKKWDLVGLPLRSSLNRNVQTTYKRAHPNHITPYFVWCGCSLEQFRCVL